MQFQHTHALVLSGQKTQTRRIVKPGDHLIYHGEYAELTAFGMDYGTLDGVYNGQRPVYRIGSKYAVQPARTKPMIYWRYSDMTGTGYEVLQQSYSPELANWGWKPARIRITSIEREDVRNISYEDACAEGFKHEDGVADTIYGGFLNTWCKMHDKKAVWKFDPQNVDYWINTGKRRELVGFHTVKEIIANRPAERYTAWALTFELVKE